MEPLAPPTPRLSVCHDRWTRRLGFTHYDVYIIASTGHAASYISPTGALVTGREKTSLSQRGSRAWKHIGEKIHNYCSHLSTLRSMLYSHIGPTCRGLNALCIRTRWSIKGGRPLEENSGWEKAKARQRIGSYTAKNNTSPSGCRVLRSGVPNHSKSCVLACLLQCEISLTV